MAGFQVITEGSAMSSTSKIIRQPLQVLSVVPRQSSLAFTSVQLSGMNSSQKARALSRLANLLMLAAGCAAEEATAIGKKLHHYVPRFYLRAWAVKKKVCCLQDNEIRSDSVRNLGAENYFYRLQELRREDLDFLREYIRENANEAAVFYRGLAVQYARTNHIKQIRLVMDRDRFALYQRIANPLVHILATNVGLSLYAERKRHKIILLDNATDVPFVTADQPVINLASAPKDTTPPTKFELYYPLSPRKAMLLIEPSSDFHSGDSSVSETFVNLYNLRMAAHSYRQVYSVSPHALESVRADLTAYMSCFPK
jgi:Protein of unknown function (DUF4238)